MAAQEMLDYSLFSPLYFLIRNISLKQLHRGHIGNIRGQIKNFCNLITFFLKEHE